MRPRHHHFLSALLCAVIAIGANPWPLMLPAATGAGAMAALIIQSEPAQARAGSSGGYSRSTGSSSFRTPALSSGGYSRSRTPSFGGGSGFSGVPSASDRAISQLGAGAALGRYDRGTARTPSFAPPAQRPSGQGYATGGGFGGSRWTLPPYAAGSPRSFGVWDAAMLWFLMSTLSQPGHAAFFYNNANDPGVQAWRADADRKAETDPALRSQLNALDQHVSALNGTPRDPGAVPPGVDATEASSSHSGWITVLVVVVGCLVLLWLWWRRQRPQPAGIRSTVRGSAMVSPLSAAVGMVRHKLSGEGYTPSLFRVGMTITLDPAPFVLIEGKTKVKMPQNVAGTERSLISVDRVGALQIGNVLLTRLYLPGGGFFQLHLNASGQPDECRYFSLLDEVTPASQDEWGFWLDDAEGAIGMPDFQAKDGKQYWRAWSPGSARVPPVEINETIQGLQGETTRRARAMLYGMPTGLAPPAPPSEYIFVAAVEQSGQASVEILAGIDFNPAALSLA